MKAIGADLLYPLLHATLFPYPCCSNLCCPMPKQKNPVTPNPPENGEFPIRLFCGIFGGVAVLLLGITATASYFAYQHRAQQQSAPGQVVAMTKRDILQSSDSSRYDRVTAVQEYFYPVVTYALPNGDKKTVQTNDGSWPPAYEQGQAVTVLYNPAKPLQVEIQSTGSAIGPWILPMITGIVGVGFMIGTIVAYRVFPPAAADQ
jgi:Protein of unknown function (DUF3592)